MQTTHETLEDANDTYTKHQGTTPCFVYVNPENLACNYSDFVACEVYLGYQIMEEVNPEKLFISPNWETLNIDGKRDNYVVFIILSTFGGLIACVLCLLAVFAFFWYKRKKTKLNRNMQLFFAQGNYSDTNIPLSELSNS
eukprot:TRINITY_DN1989_c0_g1_i1.p2 TRINITY_DN1989_c0_g1~~TRINITY_DN1989_c0_g1_i1.p2  ORF type:complete len:140 (+),score=18.19 TRINITY_DN1989_c0_g1_i1:163-582(+)